VRSWYTDAGSGINGLVPIGAEASTSGIGEQKVTLLPGRCGCGRAMLRVADIAGRRDDDLRYGETGCRERVLVCARHRPADLGVPRCVRPRRGRT
jgi:hypothetical protein